MLKKLLPVALLFLGSGAGVGAGIFWRPEAAAPMIADHPAAAKEASSGTPSHQMEYVKLSNQFVVPVVKGQKVVALVVLSLTLEVPEGRKDMVFQREPRLRDSFLQVLFDYANVGGFEGAFTKASNLKILRTALLEVGQKDMGKDIVNDVLIVEIARQDY